MDAPSSASSEERARFAAQTVTAFMTESGTEDQAHSHPSTDAHQHVVRITLDGSNIESVLGWDASDDSAEVIIDLRNAVVAAAELANVRGRRFRSRIAIIERPGRTRYLRTEHIDWIEAQNQYVRVHSAQGSFLTRAPWLSMGSLVELLDPEHFMRVHRSCIVNLDRIETLEIQHGSRYLAILSSGQELPVSPANWNALRSALAAHERPTA